MERLIVKKWFKDSNYELKFNQINPITRNSMIFAVAYPNNCGATLSFWNMQKIEEYIRQVEKIKVLILD